MNKRQYKAAYKVLAADCATTGVMLNSCGETCAVGALAVATYRHGIKAPQLGVIVDRVITAASCDFKPMLKRIEKKFGLTEGQLHRLMNANDMVARSDMQEKRRIGVLKKLEQIAKREGLKV